MLRFWEVQNRELMKKLSGFHSVKEAGFTRALLLQVVNRLLNCIHIHISSGYLVHTTSFSKLRNTAREDNHLLYIILR
jgi:hypothetical protein